MQWFENLFIAKRIWLIFKNVNRRNTKLSGIFLKRFDFEFQIAVFTETWLNEIIFKLTSMFGYNQISRQDRIGKCGDGVSIAASILYSAEE